MRGDDKLENGKLTEKTSTMLRKYSSKAIREKAAVIGGVTESTLRKVVYRQQPVTHHNLSAVNTLIGMAQNECEKWHLSTGKDKEFFKEWLEPLS